MRHFLTLAAAVTALGALPALAEDGPTCEVAQELDPHQQLRRLSLDLRGRVPALEEYQALEEMAAVTPELVSQWIASEDFRVMMRRYHEALLWPNVSNVLVAAVNARLANLSFGAMAISSTGRRNTYRGAVDVSSTELGAQCGNFEQKNFDPAFPGQFRPDPAHIRLVPHPTDPAKTVRQEGWRYVEPYWAPGTKVKVCAYDAQETPEAPVGTATVSCANAQANGRRECGCGPNLAWCYSPSATNTDTVIRNSLREQVGLSVDEVTTGGRPYTDLVLSTTAWQNGPIAHWKKHLAYNYSTGVTFNVADPQEEVLTKAFNDLTFEKVDRGGLHAGVVTLPAYLLRFQTNRARANRMRIAFECEHFVPTSAADQPGCSTTTDDLTNRCACQNCHQTLEPLASYFGQYAESGTTQLSDTALFPRESEACKTNPNTAFCRRFYVTDRNAPRFSWLAALQFADVHPELQEAFDAGPRQRAQQLIESGTFARCTVRRAFSWFVKREMQVQGADITEQDLLMELSEGFEQNGYSFPWLVEQIVSLPQYRRIR